jgi:hypothetical protein
VAASFAGDRPFDRGKEDVGLFNHPKIPCFTPVFELKYSVKKTT